CLYAACPHYRRCFIERGSRLSRGARLVVANHALVMSRAARRGDETGPPRRIVFDEGHHLFEAADSAFSVHLTGAEGAELRRWLRGPEAARRGRARGLLSRLEDLLSGDDACWALLHELLDTARVLPGPGWQRRLPHLEPQGPFEIFLSHVRTMVLARAGNTHLPHSLECGTEAPEPRLVDSAARLEARLGALAGPLATLAARLAAFLDDHAETLESDSRGRIEAAVRSLSLRAEPIGRMGDADIVDWFELARSDGREIDVGMHRHAIDPTRPFAEAVLVPAHGVVITSATLMDRHAAEAEEDWHRAETRVGARHLVEPPRRLSLPSPFDYAAQTRVLIVTDVRKNDPDRLAAACRALMLAAGGGALGLFTAIARLRATHARIAPALEAARLPLYAQHVDPIDTGTLVDIFRAERDACLLGTDAVRDGVDVPGDALRLIVFDRVPWPRPTILHKARRAAFGGAVYDDMLARLRLAQAFGRLIRRSGDRGVFVLLDAQTPTRLLSAFPPGVTPARVGLAEAVATVRDFLGGTHP
ncbi:MAG: helicase C-terminal domain-containing protein, partial [Rhodothalassiaceae bacterium]